MPSTHTHHSVAPASTRTSAAASSVLARATARGVLLADFQEIQRPIDIHGSYTPKRYELFFVSLFFPWASARGLDGQMEMHVATSTATVSTAETPSRNLANCGSDEWLMPSVRILYCSLTSSSSVCARLASGGTSRPACATAACTHVEWEGGDWAKRLGGWRLHSGVCLVGLRQSWWERCVCSIEDESSPARQLERSAPRRSFE